MYLYLIQHAEAKSKDEDPERPLTEKGLHDINLVTDFIAQYADININTVQHSGKKRAEQTAGVLAKTFTEGAVKQDDNLGALDDPEIWAEYLDESEEDIMLVGHLPYMDKLSSLLLCDDEDAGIVDFHNAGIVCLKRDDNGEWTLQWIVIPKILE